MAEQIWSDSFARTVVAAAIFGELIKKLPGAFTPALFGDANAPRQRIAAVVTAYAEKYDGAPDAITVEQLLRAEMAPRTKAEQEAVETEWQYTQAVELPDDPTFLYDQVRAWVEYTRMAQALVSAAAAIEAGPEGLTQAREILAKAEPLALDSDRSRVLQFLGDAEERMSLWASGEEYGDRIPTGLPVLDGVLNGGPTRRESWYFLAPPKGAKTMALLRVARGAAVRGFGVYVTTFEMQAIRMLLRSDRMASRATKEELRADLTKLRAVFQGMRAAGSGEIYVQEQPTQRKGSVAAVGREVERIRREGGKIDVVIFDYLNIMGSKRNEKEKRHELAAISREMSDLAKDLDVLVWSAALVNKKAVGKETITKTDIAEAFEVIAVLDGAVTICSPPGLLKASARRMWVAAAREEQDEVLAGDYKVDFARMYLEPMDSTEADRLIREGRIQRERAPRAADGEEI